MTSALTTIFTPRSVIGAAVALAFTCQAQAAQYSVQFLETGGYEWVAANGINNAGQIVGLGYVAGFSGAQAVLWNGTAITTLSSSGRYSSAEAINDHGVIAGTVGTVGAADDQQVAVTWNAAGQRTDIGTPGRYSQGLAINNAGQVGGIMADDAESPQRATIWNGTVATEVDGPLPSAAYAIDGAGRLAGAEHRTGFSQATLWSGGQKTTLAGLGNNYSYATAMNEAGLVAGYAFMTNTFHYRAVTWDASGMPTELPTPDGYDSDVGDVNNRGQILGSMSLRGGDEVRFVIWDGETLIDLSASLDAKTLADGWVLSGVSGFNDAGRVIGQLRLGTTITVRPVLLTPVPEPEALAMMLAGVGLVGLMGWRRRRATAA